MPCIENLRRQKKVGRETWLEEQARYWTNDVIRKRWLTMFSKVERAWLEEKRLREEEKPQASTGDAETRAPEK